MRFRNRRSWIRKLGLVAVPLVIAASFLGLLIGITGLCVGADDMHRPEHPVTLCLFFCGAIVAPVVLLVPLWPAVAALVEQEASPPFSAPRSIFHPPTVIPA